MPITAEFGNPPEDVPVIITMTMRETGLLRRLVGNISPVEAAGLMKLDVTEANIFLERLYEPLNNLLYHTP